MKDGIFSTPLMCETTEFGLINSPLLCGKIYIFKHHIGYGPCRLAASTFDAFYRESGQSYSRPDAVSSVLICADRVELCGLQPLSDAAVSPLEKKQKS